MLLSSHARLPRPAAVLSLVTTLFLAVPSLAVTVTIDPSERHQTMDGFGAFAQCQRFDMPSYVEFLHDDVGFTMFRVQVPYDFEITNDNGDPNSLNMDGFNYNSDGYKRWNEAIVASKSYDDIRVIASVWTPPPWMKDNNEPNNGGHLLPSMREELAEFLVGYYRAVQRDCGVDLYAISIQNESAFEEWYVSCVYTSEEYRDALKVVGARFEAEGIDCLLFGAEDMLHNIARNPYFGYINVDPVAKGYLDVAAVHGYSDGINPLPSSTGAQEWGRLGQVASGLGVKAWMTETSGFSESWGSAMQIASNIAMAMRYADLSAWTFWSDAENDGMPSEFALLSNFQHTQRSYASKMFYRYVRPGSVRIGCDLVTEDALGVAVHHPVDQTFTMVIVNNGLATSVELTGGDLPAQLTKYTSTSTKHCVDEGSVASGGSISIDGSSVTTLVGEGYNPAIVAAVQPQRNRPAVGRMAPGGMHYTLDGRMVGQNSQISPPASGIVVTRTAGATARFMVR